MNLNVPIWIVNISTFVVMFAVAVAAGRVYPPALLMLVIVAVFLVGFIAIRLMQRRFSVGLPTAAFLGLAIGLLRDFSSALS